ncbi:MAG: 4-(cytidine 5'-diphospho)-2-C-methyl-D-erythritol kinase [Eubacteriaceae bacterium]
MEKIVEKAYGKVNITLDVLGTNEKGYHEMQMINHSITLHDTLTFTPKDTDLVLTCDNKDLEVNEKNLIVVAAKKIQAKYGLTCGASIHLDKKIPMEAGLGGGSSDAAAALKGLCRLWKVNISQTDLLEIGLSIGADVPYCLIGGTALVEGIGERIKPLSPMKKLWVVVIKPEVSISTPQAFKELDKLETLKHPEVNRVIETLEIEDYTGLRTLCGNVFEEVIFPIYPEIKRIKEKLLQLDALVALMTGSGSTVVGYFEDREKAKGIFEIFSNDYEKCFFCEVC